MTCIKVPTMADANERSKKRQTGPAPCSGGVDYVRPCFPVSLLHKTVA
jgi:hypothetical protein